MYDNRNSGVKDVPRTSYDTISKLLFELRKRNEKNNAYVEKVKHENYLAKNEHERDIILRKNALKLIEESGLFDELYYELRYPKDVFIYDSAIKHYLEVGSYMNFNPSLWFDEEYYKDRYSVKSKYFSGIIHYILREDKDVPVNEFESNKFYFRKKVFNPEWYVYKNKDIDFSTTDPLVHFIKHGINEKREPSYWFYSDSYFKKNLEKNCSQNIALKNFLASKISSQFNFLFDEMIEILNEGGFDSDWYLSAYTDVAKLGLDPIRHYITYGWKEGRLPYRLFKNECVISFSPWVYSININPLYYQTIFKKYFSGYKGKMTKLYLDLKSMDTLHIKYLEDELVKERQCMSFDSEWYFQKYKDVYDNCVDAASHFDKYGWHEGRNPNRWFNTKKYLKANNVVGNGAINPFVEFVTSHNIYNQFNRPICEKDVLMSTGFDSKWYHDQYSDFIGTNEDAIEHYINIGWKIGLNPNGWFSSKFIELTYNDIYDLGISPLLYYILYVKNSGAPASKFPALIKRSGKELRSFNNPAVPLITIIIPVYNGFKYTVNCLLSVYDNTDFLSFPCEIIIADDCSTDETRNLQDYFPDVIVCKTERNIGFGQNCNNAATMARGKYILFLNNDTIVHPWWECNFIATMESDPDVGIVGGSVVYPDNVLQAAGATVQSDGKGLHFGQWDKNINNPEWHYVRDVLYIPGSFLLIDKKLWDDINGFDPIFSPAYCEDVDLCLAAHAKGRRVMYQPFSRITHFESKSFKEKSRQLIDKNTCKLKEKWCEVIQNLPAKYDDIFLQKDLACEKKKTVLVLDHIPPEYDKHAGGRATWNFILQKKIAGFNVKFYCFYSNCETSVYLDRLRKYGVESWSENTSGISWKTWIRERSRWIDIVVIHRPAVALKTMDYIQQQLGIPVIFFGHDLHFLRLKRQNEIKYDAEVAEEIKHIREIEFDIYTKADLSLTPSDVELQILKKEFGLRNNIKTIPLFSFQKFIDGKPSPQDRRGILFIGSYNHQPNIDAVNWFLDEIWPSILEMYSETEFFVLGSGMTEEKFKPHNNTHFLGFVSDDKLKDIYKSIRVVVAPLRYGAGIKGKVLEAFSKGIPVVGTSIAFEGINVFNETKADIANDFAHTVGILLIDNAFWRTVSSKEIKIINNDYSFDAAIDFWKSNIGELIERCSRGTDVAIRNEHPDTYSILYFGFFDINYYTNQIPSILRRGLDPLQHYLNYGETMGLSPTPSFNPHIYNDHADVCSKKSLLRQWLEKGMQYGHSFNKFIMPLFHVPTKYEKQGNHVLVISPVSSETKQGNSVRIKGIITDLKNAGYVIHYVYYPFDASLDNGEKMPWDYIYRVNVQGEGVHRLKYTSEGSLLKDAHLIDDWCGQELVFVVDVLARLWDFRLCICNYVWLSKTLLSLNNNVFKIIDTHDKFSYKDRDVATKVGMEHNGWYSTTEEEEKIGLMRADKILAIQDKEGEYFSRLVGNEKVQVLGVKFPEQFLNSKPYNNKITIGYIAGVNPFNLKAIDVFYKKWSHNHMLLDKTSLFIGGLIGRHLLQSNKKMDKAEIIGIVPDVKNFYEKCDIVINPDFGGTGLKIKSLEALSFGRPLLVSARSMEGIKTSYPYHKIKDIDEFIDMLSSVVNTPGLLKDMEAASKKVFQTYISLNTFSINLSSFSMNKQAAIVDDSVTLP